MQLGISWLRFLLYMNTISGGTIRDNKAGVDGGGIYAGCLHWDKNSSFIVDVDFFAGLDVSGSAVINDNKAGADGGGIWIVDLKNLTVAKYVIFSGNKAETIPAASDSAKKTPARSAPKTGDESSLLFEIFLLILGLGGTILLVVIRKKENEKVRL